MSGVGQISVSARKVGAPPEYLILRRNVSSEDKITHNLSLGNITILPVLGDVNKSRSFSYVMHVLKFVSKVLKRILNCIKEIEFSGYFIFYVN
jgi:hypothetical protein